MKDKFEFYKDKRDEWRWRYRAKNGKIIATSSEGYKNKSDCLKGIDLVKGTNKNTPIERKRQPKNKSKN